MDIIRTILPPLCELCRCASTDYLCPGCQSDLAINRHACPVCALPLEEDDEKTECPACLLRPKPFDLSICAFRYTHPVDQLVLHFKRKGPHALLALFGDALIRAVQQTYTTSPLPDAIMPVPQHWWRQLKRGFHPTRLLADRVGQALDLPVLPKALISKHSTQQKSLRRTARLRSLAQAFDVQPSRLPRTVAIVDDVITTGATAETLTNLLKDKGLDEVHIWALARAP